MERWPRIWLALLAVTFLIATVSAAASSASFCKCTCYSESVIIALNADPDDAESTKGLKSCNECNKRSCLDYGLNICEGAELDDVTTTCFQRDSAKDQAFVLIFIIGTAGLLVYAALRPWIQKTIDNVQERRIYVPLGNQN